MSWTDATRFHRTLTAVEAALDLTPDGALPWDETVAAVFDTPQRLRFALLSRWRTIVEAQAEDVLVSELAAAHPGLARLAGLDHAALVTR